MNAVDWLVISAGILGLVGYVPQIIAMIRTRKIDGLNIWWVASGEVAWVVWLWYGIYIGNRNMVILYTAGSVLQGAILLLLLKIRYSSAGK